jgi:hypothetical protein
MKTTPKNPTWQGEAAARDDGGQRTGVAERPGDWIPDDDAGEATRDYCSHDSENSLGGRPRERPKRRGRRRRSLLSDRNGRAVAIAVITTPHVTSHRVAYACARMTQHNKRKNITKNRGRREDKKRCLLLLPGQAHCPDNTCQHNKMKTNLCCERVPRELVSRAGPTRAGPSRATEPPSRRAELQVRFGCLKFGFNW